MSQSQTKALASIHCKPGGAEFVDSGFYVTAGLGSLEVDLIFLCVSLCLL